MEFAIIAAVVLAILAVAAQFNIVNLRYSRLASSTFVSVAEKPRQGELVSHVEIERPIWRWIPFVKVGNTTYRHTYQYSIDNNTVLERAATTKTHLWVIGLCSTSRYDSLADAPFQKTHQDYLKSLGK